MIRHADPPIPAELLAIPDHLMPETDGKPMDSEWHRDCMVLLIEVVDVHRGDRNDYYAGGNMCIYYSAKQVLKKDFLGPDFFYVKDTQRRPMRDRWIVWREGMRYPNAIIELLSPSTKKKDRGKKKTIYEKTFQTANYFLYDPKTKDLTGFHLVHGVYEPLTPNEHGWLWSEEMQLWLGVWQGKYRGNEAVWLRFYDKDGNLLPTIGEKAAQEQQRAEQEMQRADHEKHRAEQEKQRADAAEAELARLRALIAQQKSNGGKA